MIPNENARYNRCIAKMYATILTLVLLTIVLLPEVLFAQGSVVAYAFGKEKVQQNTLSSFPSNNQLNKLTHVVVSAIGCLNDGKLFIRDLPQFWQTPSPATNIWNGSTNRWIEDLRIRAHKRGVKVSICISGDSNDKNFAFATYGSTLNTFVDNIVSFVNVHGIDGVDINWEYPQDEDEWAQLIALLNELKTALPSKRISVALSGDCPGDYPNSSIPKNIWNTVDAIHLMTYDMPVPRFPSHSDVTASKASIDAWKNFGNTFDPVLNKAKLFMGCAFYGKDTNGIKVPYWDGGGSITNRSDTPASIEDKANYCYTNGYGGVMIYRLDFDIAKAKNKKSLLNKIWSTNKTLAK